MSRPSVSAVVTTYNQAPYIEAALGSVLAQTYPVAEIVVVDDGSTDDTPARLESFAGRIRCIRQDNRGVAGARNAGIRHARGELLALLDGDDLWAPDKIRRQVEEAIAHPHVGLLAVDGVSVRDRRERPLFGAELEDVLTPGGRPAIIRDGYRRLLQLNFIPTTSQVMIPAAVLRQVGPSDERFPVASDYDLYLRIAARHPLLLIPERLVHWRYVPSSVSGPSDEREFRWGVDILEVLRKHARQAHAGARSQLETRIDELLREIVVDAYVRGHRNHRRWASRFLWTTARRHRRRALLPLAYLAGLWSPRLVNSLIGKMLRSRLC